MKSFGRTADRKVSYLVSLFCKTSSELVALVDGKHLTSMRTAATSAVAVDAILPQTPVSVGLLGSGNEAKAHAQAIAAVRPFTNLDVFSPTPAKREKLAVELAVELNIPVRAVDSAELAVRNKSLVIAAARSYDEKPILLGGWLKQGAMLVSIGSTIPEQREIDIVSIERSDLIVCDMVDEVLDQTGDFLAARAAGIECKARVATLNALVMGELSGRLKSAKNVMYKSVGAAVQDVTAAALALKLAQQSGQAITIAADLEIQNV